MLKKIKDLAELFGVFFLIGMLNWGGGYSVMPFLQREIVEKRKWLTDVEMVDYYILGQCLPGLILINTATFVGYRKQRFLGAVAATTGMVMPGLASAFLISIVLFGFLDLPLVQSVILGINVAVVVLIFQALMQFLKISIVDKATIFIFIGAFLLCFYISPVWIILGAGVFGFLLKKLRGELS